MADTRILLATDGSAGAQRALELVTSSFEPGGVRSIEVISVVARAVSTPEAWAEATPRQALEQSHRAAARQRAEAAVETLAASGFRAVATVRTGHPADTIVTHAIASRPDLIVLGTRGLVGRRRRVIGSVSGKVARYAPTSVLVAQTAGPVRRILLGYDASPDADEALELVARLPLRGEPAVTVLSAYDVTPPFAAGIAPTMVAQARAAYRDSLRWAAEAADAMASSAAQRLREAGLTAAMRTARGPAHRQLAIVASELPADLLVVGSRGLSAIQRFFLGSTSAALLTRPPTSVLVARPTGV